MGGRIRQRSPGTWQISYGVGRDALCNRRTKAETVRDTKADAQRRLREILTYLDNGQRPAPAAVPPCDWLAHWMRDVVIPNRRQGTVERYRGAVRNYILPSIGNVSLQDFGSAQVQVLESCLSRRVEPGDQRPRLHRVVSPVAGQGLQSGKPGQLPQPGSQQLHQRDIRDYSVRFHGNRSQPS